MFFTERGRCPVCGIVANMIDERNKIRNCPICGTVFTEFGIILSSDMKEELTHQNN